MNHCIPPPSFAPASRGTFPQGKVLAVTFRGYHSTGAVPTALRKREDNILPYSGVGTIHRTVFRIWNVATPHQSRLSAVPASPPGGSCGTFYRSTGLACYPAWAGRLIASPTGAALKRTCFHCKSVTGRVRARAEYVLSPCGTEKPGGSGHLLDW